MGFIGTLVSCAVFLAVIGVSIWLSIYYLGDRNSLPDQLPDLDKYLPDLELFHREDPFSKVNESDANRWPNDGSGLDLELINCLDSIWYDYFDVAVQEWDNGTPDALTLTTSTGTPEFECSAVDGVMKVCNGDYGETDWKGINTVLLSNGWITSSSARMNDHFFVDGSDADKRQYTMCHELGHGFGLPHTDESFWNRDLGNCLDYTNNFSGNKSPDSFLYNFLADLYGSVDGSRVPNVTTTNGGGFTGGDGATDDGSGGGTTANQSPENRRFRNLSGNRHQRQLFPLVTQRSRRRYLESRWGAINAQVLSGFKKSDRDGWRLLHSSEFGEAHEIDLDDEYKVQVHLLLA